MNARFAVFNALLFSETNDSFIEKLLLEWKKKNAPEEKDYRLAIQIANGTIKYKLVLDQLIKQIARQDKLRLKLKMKVALRMAFYQHFFMDRIPLYANISETMKILKKHLHSKEPGFCYQILKKLETAQFSKEELQSLIDQYAYPLFFKELVEKEYGLEKAAEILSIGNLSPKYFYRKRDQKEDAFVEITNPTDIEKVQRDAVCYIQNKTSYLLFQNLLGSCIDQPKNVLDLCASPGGKLLIAHDFFKEARLFANDSSKERLYMLEENIKKYGLEVDVKNLKAQNYPLSQKFDLIIVDAPCSNSGVLRKRAEARFRINQENLDQLNVLQKEIMERASMLLSEKGLLLYMTCSILEEENEGFVKSFSNKYKDLHQVACQKIVPDIDGNDGGFACLFSKKKP